jgi:hypothetical protein
MKAPEKLPFDPQAGPVETLHPGLTFQWLFNEQVMVFTAQHTSRELVDAWAARIMQLANSWPSGRVMYTINDFSARDCAVTPYNRQKNTELLASHPEIAFASAIVLQPNATYYLTRLFVRIVPQRNKVLVTTSRNEAIIWMKRLLDEQVAVKTDS